MVVARSKAGMLTTVKRVWGTTRKGRWRGRVEVGVVTGAGGETKHQF